MSENQAPRRDAKEHPHGSAGPRRRPPRWGLALLVGSVVLMAAAIAVPLVLGSGSAGPRAPISSALPAGAQGLVAGGGAAPTSAGEGEAAPSVWSPAVFRLGFGFFVGFAVAYALRSFFKLAIVFAGFFFLALMGLEHAGVIDVRWGMVEQQYGTASHWLTGQFESVKAFVTGYLPSTGAAATGLAAGFLRRS